MEILVTGRHIEVKERFRRHVLEKLAKVPQLAPRKHVVVVHLGQQPQRALPAAVSLPQARCQVHLPRYDE